MPIRQMWDQGWEEWLEIIFSHKGFDMRNSGFAMNWRPRRDLNPCYRRERAMS